MSKVGVKEWKAAYEGLAWQMKQVQADLDEATKERDMGWRVLLTLHYLLEFTDVPREEIQSLLAKPFAQWNLETDPLWHEVVSLIKAERERRQAPEAEAQ
jgi:hypothetical protein